MSKKIGLIAEDQSDIDVIINLLAKYVARNEFTTKKFIGNGCGKLKNKCDTWAKQLFDSGCSHVIVFHDLDRNDEATLRETLQKKIPQAIFPNSLIVIPIEELEAWLLSDVSAIKSVFSLKKAPKKFNSCESVKSPKESLEKIIWTLGKKRYLNTVHNQKIAEKTSLIHLRRCASFVLFDTYVRERVFPKLLARSSPSKNGTAV